MPRFFLGTHEPAWLQQTDVPLFLSRRRLCRRVSFPRARGPWALDSGGFSELSLHGRWTITPEQYVAEVRLWSREIGLLEWAAAMDWMCEPFILEKTGLSVREHQRLTVDNYLELRTRAPELPWVPVLQGWSIADYLGHVEDYARAGVELAEVPLVGLGSVCRRQDTSLVEALIRALSPTIKLHGFGFKIRGLARVAPFLTSADSLSWSFHARKHPALLGCRHLRCNNCLRFALLWREKVLSTMNIRLSEPTQISLL